MPNFNTGASTNIANTEGLDITDKSPKTSIVEQTQHQPSLQQQQQHTPVETPLSPTGGGVGRFNVKRVAAVDHLSPRETSTPPPSQSSTPTDDVAASSKNSTSASDATTESVVTTISPRGRFSVKPVAVHNQGTSSTIPLKQQVDYNGSNTPQQQNLMTPQSSFEAVDSSWGTLATSQDASTDTELDAKEVQDEGSSRIAKSNNNKPKHSATVPVPSTTDVTSIDDNVVVTSSGQTTPSESPSLRRRQHPADKKPGPRVNSTVLEFDPLIVTPALETITVVSSSNTTSVSSTDTQPTATEMLQTTSNTNNDNNYDPNNVDILATGCYGSGTNIYCSSFSNSRCSSRTASPIMNVTPSGSLENIKQYAAPIISSSTSCGATQQSAITSSLLSALKGDETVSFFHVYWICNGCLRDSWPSSFY